MSHKSTESVTQDVPTYVTRCGFIISIVPVGGYYFLNKISAEMFLYKLTHSVQ